MNLDKLLSLDRLHEIIKYIALNGFYENYIFHFGNALREFESLLHA